MIEETKQEDKFIKSVRVEYEDGTSEVVEGFVIVVSEDKANGRWAMQISDEVEIERILDFAYDAVDMIENENLDKSVAKKSHLRLVKG